MELRQLRYFQAVAEARSFTLAARRLRVAQPALSQQIRALEEELGVVLLERSNRTGGLTDAGVALLARAERILAEVHDAGAAMADLAGLRAGVVRIGCALQTLAEGRLPPLLGEFCAEHPRIRVVLREVHTATALQLLSRGAVDLALVHLGQAGTRPPVGARAAGDALALAQLYREPLVAIVGREHRLAARTAVRFSDLRDEPFIAFRPGSTVRQLVADAAQQAGFVPRLAFSTANLGTVRAFVAAGLGIAVVPRSAVVVPGPPLALLRISTPRLERIVTLARNPSRYESAAVQAMRRHLVERLISKSLQ
jgi:DNA-binding transcriptional LysR family regulator